MPTVDQTDQATPFQRHRERWENCRRCPLCEHRQHVVLARGKIPCDVLAVGEAPGLSEDVRGIPLDGPAGLLWDSLLARAVAHSETRFRHACTNIVACIPLGDEGKAAQPPRSAISECKPRFLEMIALAKPKLIVCLGGLATKWVRKHLGVETANYQFCDLIHPAGLIRLEVNRRLEEQRCVIQLTNALNELKEHVRCRPH